MDFSNINIVASYIHGSEDSCDVDRIYVLDKIPEFSICKAFCASLEDNANLMTIEDGVVSWCFKGSKDEVNNGVFSTYNLHKQDYELKITRMVERDVCLKVIRATRGILSHLSRSQYREDIKSALRASFSERLVVLNKIKLGEIDFDSLNKNMSGADIKKLIAFQIGQTIALINDIELFTKREIGENFPSIRPYLYREECDTDRLQTYLFTLIDILENMGIKDCGDRIVEYNGNRYDLKTEEKL